jgi:hypothetical protein
MPVQAQVATITISGDGPFLHSNSGTGCSQQALTFLFPSPQYSAVHFCRVPAILSNQVKISPHVDTSLAIAGAAQAKEAFKLRQSQA